MGLPALMLLTFLKSTISTGLWTSFISIPPSPSSPLAVLPQQNMIKLRYTENKKVPRSIVTIKKFINQKKKKKRVVLHKTILFQSRIFLRPIDNIYLWVLFFTLLTNTLNLNIILFVNFLKLYKYIFIPFNYIWLNII